jgi:hypothetical protein
VPRTSKRQRIYFEQGWADGDPRWIEVGDRAIPRRIDVTFPSTEERWPALHLVIEARSGVPQCTELVVRADPQGREVRDLDFRHIRLDDWIETIVAEFAMEAFTAEDGTRLWRKSISSGGSRSAEVDAQTRAARKAIGQARKGARRKMTDELLGRVAVIYRDNLDNRPVEAVSGALGVQHRTAARYVQLARAQGLLPRTTQGKARA